MWNFWIQQFLVIGAASLSVVFIVKKFFVTKKGAKSKSCGSSGCGCN